MTQYLSKWIKIKLEKFGTYFFSEFLRDETSHVQAYVLAIVENYGIRLEGFAKHFLACL